jgi:hypothetical protein
MSRAVLDKGAARILWKVPSFFSWRKLVARVSCSNEPADVPNSLIRRWGMPASSARRSMAPWTVPFTEAKSCRFMAG